MTEDRPPPASREARRAPRCALVIPLRRVPHDDPEHAAGEHDLPVVVRAVGLLLAYAVAAMPQPDGTHYYWEIMLPGSVLGVIVGYATQRYHEGNSRSQGASSIA